MKKCIQFFILAIYTLHLASTASAGTLVVGSVSEDPSEEMANFLPFTKYLATKLAKHGITDSKVVIAKNLDEMREMFAQGKVDLYIDSPISAYSVIKNGAGEFLLRRWKKGISEYHSVIFVKADSQFKDISDLLGHTLLFEEEFSSSGYLLPKFSLHKMGYSLQKQQSIKAPVTEVFCAFNGRQGIELLKEAEPDLVITDVLLHKLVRKFQYPHDSIHRSLLLINYPI